MATLSAPSNPYQYFNFDVSDPDAIVVLNRGTQFEKDITNDVRSAQTSNSIESIAGSFNLTVDNTNDAYVDRFGHPLIKVMSSIEIFAKSLTIKTTPDNLNVGFDSTQIPADIKNLNQFINVYYNNPSSSARDKYQQQIIALNSQRQTPNDKGVAVPDPITDNDFILADNIAGRERMDSLRQSPLRVPSLDNLYQRVFFGVVLNVSQNINPGGELTLNLTGKSIGYWLEATPVNIHPGGFEYAFNNTDPTVYANRYATTAAMDIFRDLIRFSTDDLVAVTDFNTDSYSTGLDVIELNGKIDVNILDAFGNPQKEQKADGTLSNEKLAFKTINTGQKINEIENKVSRLYQGIPANNNVSDSTSDAITGSSAWTRASQKYVTDTRTLSGYASGSNQAIAALKNQIASAQDVATRNVLQIQLTQLQQTSSQRISQLQQVVRQDKIDIEAIPEFQIQYQGLSQQMDELKKSITSAVKAGRSNVLNQFGIINHWKNIFSKMILEVVDTNNFLGLIQPLKIAFSAPDASLDGDYISKADMADMVVKNLMYEFYVDTNGHFVLKPPLYNIGIQPDNPDYIVEEDDIVSMTTNESVEGIITRIGVTGDVIEPVTLERIQIYNMHQDLNLIRDYGFHATEIANRLFLRNNSDCRDFGKSYMIKNNMELNNASLTINGRAGIRLGTSIYVKPRDTVYYIKEINHEITAGGQFQTTLTLIGARRIVTGFKAQSTLRVVNLVTGYKPTPDQPGMSIDTQNTFHYILSSAVNPEAITDANIKSGPAPGPGNDNQQYNREQALSIEQASAVLENPNTALLLGQSISPNDMVNQKAQLNGYVPQILRNVYQITNHINPSYIGLIVDFDSEAISSINVANYKFFADLTVDSISKSFDILNIPNNKRSNAVERIKASFAEFIAKNNVSDPNKFTLNLRDQFILFFLKQSVDRVTASTVTSGGKQQSVSQDDMDAANAAVVFNQIIAQVDNGGVYRQYTDGDGRELPSYLDYGKSLLIERESLTLSEFVNIAKASEQQKKDAEAKRKADAAKRFTRPSKSQATVNKAVLAQLAQVKGKTFDEQNSVASGLAETRTAQSLTELKEPLPPLDLKPLDIKRNS